MERRKYSLALALIWLTSVAFTWGIVENPLYDFSGYLQASARVAAGQTPYLDFQWIYPPLMLWVNGIIMHWFSDSYAVVNSLANLLALALLIAEYRLARLVLSRPLSLLCAAAAYAGMFATSSANGENFISSDIVYGGVALFAWFVWCTAQGFILRRGLRYVLLAGICGGLSMLVKHEFVAGVAAVSVYLVFRTAALNFSSVKSLLWGGLAISGIALAGLTEAARHCGWNNLWAGMTAYGTLREHAHRSYPSLVQVWQHLLMLGGYTALLLTLGRFSSRRSCTQTQGQLLDSRGVLPAWIIVATGILLEIGRVWIAITNSGADPNREVPQTVAWAGLYAKQAPDASSIAFYFGSIVCRNIVPVVMLLAIMGVLLAVRTYRHGIQRSMRSRQALLWLLCFAGLGLQARGQLSLSFPGVLDVALPLVIFAVPMLWRPFHPIRWTPGHFNALRQRCAVALLMVCMTLAVMLYAFEFRASRFSSLALETDKGWIRLPITDENKALKDMVNYVHHHGLKNIMAVPYWGLQYWTGHAAFPAWLGFIHPDLYPSPWRGYLERELKQQQITFVVFNKLDVNYLALPSQRSDLWDGPWYKPYRWKEAFPDLWHAISSHGELKCSFGPPDDSYFSVYTYSPPGPVQSATNVPTRTNNP
jgi:hypothetical protein